MDGTWEATLTTLYSTGSGRSTVDLHVNVPVSRYYAGYLLMLVLPSVLVTSSDCYIHMYIHNIRIVWEAALLLLVPQRCVLVLLVGLLGLLGLRGGGYHPLQLQGGITISVHAISTVLVRGLLKGGAGGAS